MTSYRFEDLFNCSKPSESNIILLGAAVVQAFLIIVLVTTIICMVRNSLNQKNRSERRPSSRIVSRFNSTQIRSCHTTDSSRSETATIDNLSQPLTVSEISQKTYKKEGKVAKMNRKKMKTKNKRHSKNVNKKKLEIDLLTSSTSNSISSCYKM